MEFSGEENKKNMSFTFYCPNCNQKLEAEDEWATQQADCPNCGKKITIAKADNLTTSDVKKSFNVYLLKTSNAIDTITAIRIFLQCDLMKAKDIVESTLPVCVLPETNFSKGNEFRNKLEAAGAQVKVLMVGSEEDKMMEKGIYFPSEDTGEKGDTGNSSSVSPANTQEKKTDVAGTVGAIIVILIFLAIVALVVWLGWRFVFGFPRIAFWIIAPIIGFVILSCANKLNKFVLIMLCCGIVSWGWWAHHSKTSVPDTQNGEVSSQSVPSTQNGKAQSWMEIYKSRSYTSEISNVMSDFRHYDVMADNIYQQIQNGTYRTVQLLEIMAKKMDCSYSSVNDVMADFRHNDVMADNIYQQIQNGTYRTVQLLEIITK